MEASLHKEQTVLGLKWNLLNQIITQASVFTVSLILMRYLGPGQFGLLGMVTVFSGFLSVFKNFGLGSSLIQKKDLDDLDKHTIFWVSMGLGIVLALLLIIASPILALFYKEPQITAIASTLSLLFIFQALGSTHTALLRKKLLYKKLFWVSIPAIIGGGIVAMIAVYQGLGVWALILQQLIVGFFTTIILWVVSKYRPKLRFSIERLRSHLKFGLPLVGTQSFNYWSRNADNLLIGRFLGADQLGLYSRAYSIMMLPVSRISGVIANVMFPSLAIIQEDKKRVKNIYLKMSRVIAFVTFPLMGALIVVAEPFVKAVLGEQWMGMVNVLQILAVVGALQSIGTLNGNIFMSQGKTKLQFKLNVFSGVIVVSAFSISVHFDIEAVAWAYLTAVFIIMIPKMHIMGKLISCTLLEIIRNLLSHIIISITLMAIVFFTLSFLGDISNLQLLIIGVLEFSIGWIFLMYLFNRTHFAEIVSIKNNLLRKKNSREAEKLLI